MACSRRFEHHRQSEYGARPWLAGVTKIEAASRGIACRADVLWCDPVDQRIRRQYTCRAGTQKNDCDVYTIADGKDDSKPIVRIRAKGRIKTLKGQITRFTEGRAREDRSPEAHARRTHHRSATTRVVRERCACTPARAPVRFSDAWEAAAVRRPAPTLD